MTDESPIPVLSDNEDDVSVLLENINHELIHADIDVDNYVYSNLNEDPILDPSLLPKLDPPSLDSIIIEDINTPIDSNYMELSSIKKQTEVPSEFPDPQIFESQVLTENDDMRKKSLEHLRYLNEKYSIVDPSLYSDIYVDKETEELLNEEVTENRRVWTCFDIKCEIQ